MSVPSPSDSVIQELARLDARVAEVLKDRELVEAAGVEPASESTPSRNSTCVAALESSRLPSKSDGNRQPLAPMNLVVARRSRQRRPASCYDILPRPGGEDVEDVAT